MQSSALVQSTIQDIAHIKTAGMHPVIIHGGGPEISKMCRKMGIASTFVQGLRVTDDETLAVVQMVLVGKINKELVSKLNLEGTSAVGLSGHDGDLLLAKQIDPDLGFVGEVVQVNPKIITTLIEAGYIPVIAPIGKAKNAQSYNINADSVAAAIAMALKADQLIFLTDVPGVLKDPKDVNTKIVTIKNSEIHAMIEDGALKEGMIPKMIGALTACQSGVHKVHILDGRIPHCLLLHFQGIEQQGTTIHG